MPGSAQSMDHKLFSQPPWGGVSTIILILLVRSRKVKESGHASGIWTKAVGLESQLVVHTPYVSNGPSNAMILAFDNVTVPLWSPL